MLDNIETTAVEGTFIVPRELRIEFAVNVVRIRENSVFL